MGIKSEIIEYSRKIFIDEIGFTSLKAFYDDEIILNERRNTGNYTEFEEEDIRKRIYPSEYFSGKSSAIVITEYYGSGHEHCDNLKNRGKLSISAQGMDYHKILKKKLNLLGDFIKKNYDIEYSSHVDTDPLLERSLAVRAGLGWIGKNTCFYSNKWGSFVFIGVLLIDEYLQYDDEKPFFSMCSNCNICIKNCPTGAIKETGYEIDIKKCISYNTVTKDNFNFDIAESMKNSFYGCDVCQISCPKNVEFSFNIKDYFIGEFEDNYPKISDVLERSNSQYKKIYKDSAIFWRGNKILKRNAILSLLNVDEKDALKILDDISSTSSDYLNKYICYVRKIIKDRNSY